MSVSNPIRVLHVLSNLSFGGVQSFIMNYYRNIDKSKVQFDFVVQNNDKKFFYNEIKELGGHIFTITDINDNRKRFESELFDILKNNPKYKIIHVHQNFLNIYALRVAKKAKVPIRISHSHSNYPASSLMIELKRKIFRKIIKIYATDYYACSIESAKWLYGESILKNQKYKIIKNAIDVDKFKFNLIIRNKIRDELNIKHKTTLIHVGMFTDAKNHKYILDIFKSIHEKNKNIDLILIGDGKNKDNIIDTARKYKIQSNIHFIGKVDNVNEYLMAADYFIFPSKYEGLGMAAIEAQISGLKCMISDVVPKEVDLFNDSIFMSIKEDHSIWADFIIKQDISRKERLEEEIKRCGYSIKEEANNLMLDYLNSL